MDGINGDTAPPIKPVSIFEHAAMRERPILSPRRVSTDVEVKRSPGVSVVTDRRLAADRRGIEEKPQHDVNASEKGGAVAVPLWGAYAVIPLVKI